MAVGAKEPIIDAGITIDDVDLSTVSNAVKIEDSAEEKDVTGFQGGGYTEQTQGLKTATITITFWQDRSAGSVHQTLKPIYDSGDAVEVRIVPDALDAISEENPETFMIGKLYGYNPVDAQAGEPESLECVFRNASSMGLVENTEAS